MHMCLCTCMCGCMCVCVGICVVVTENCWKGADAGPKCQADHRSRVRAFGLQLEGMLLTIVVTAPEDNVLPQISCLETKGFLSRETAGWQGEKKSCESITLLAESLVVTEEEA